MSEPSAQPAHSPDPTNAPVAQPAAPSVPAPASEAHPGYQHQPVGYVAAAAPSQKNGLATAALILGIVGFVVTMIPVGIGVFLGGPLNILAFIFGIIGAVKSGKLPGNLGRAAAVTGIVLSSVAFLLMFVGAGWLW